MSYPFSKQQSIPQFSQNTKYPLQQPRQQPQYQYPLQPQQQYQQQPQLQSQRCAGYRQDPNQFSDQLKRLVEELQKLWIVGEQIQPVNDKGEFVKKLNSLQKQYDNDIEYEKNLRQEQSKQFEQELKQKQNQQEQIENQYQNKIENLNSIIKQKENEINSRISVIQTKDNQINSCNERVKQKDNEIKQHNAIIQQKDNEINKNNNLIRQKDDEIIKNTTLIRQKDSEIININSILRQKDDQIKNNDNLLKKKENEIKQHKTMIQQKDNEINKNNNMIRQKDDEIERLKLQLSNALKDIEQKQQQLVEADKMNTAKIKDYEQKIAKSKSETSLLFQVLDSVKSKHQSRDIERIRTQNPEAQMTLCELCYNEVNGNYDQNLGNSDECPESLILQNTMNSVRFNQHLCEVHGKPIELFCIDQIYNHQSRRKCSRCVRKSESNIAHIDNILECLINFRLKDQQIKHMKKAQLRQQFQNANHQIMEHLNRISQIIDSKLQQLKGDSVVEYLINELVSKDTISTDQIEKLASHISTVITQENDDGEYKINTIYHIEDEQSYINCIEILSQHNKILKQILNVPSEVHNEVQNDTKTDP